MDNLPMEVVRHIISFLDLRCQLQVSAVSVQWRAAVSDCLRRRRGLDWFDVEGDDLIPTDDVLRALLPRLPALKELDVVNLQGVKPDIDIVSENCPSLEKLDLSQFELDTDSLERLCRRCPRLWDVRMSDCESDMLELLLHRLPGVRALNLEETDVSKTAELLFPDGLERLTLELCQLTGSPWLKPGRWPRLTELVLNHITGPADGLAALVKACPQLQSLSTAWTNADDKLLKVLPALPLRHLNITSCTDMTEQGLAICLCRLRQLESLDITGVHNVTDRVLHTLVGAESLKELTLGDFADTGEMQIKLTMKALRWLVVTSPSLMTVRLNREGKRGVLFVKNKNSQRLLSWAVGRVHPLADPPVHQEVDAPPQRAS